MSQTSAVIHDTDFFIRCLTQMRDYGGAATTVGLPERTLLAFLPRDPALSTAIERAYSVFEGLQTTHQDLLKLDEDSQTARVQDGYLNFYAQDQINPYVALAAQGLVV